MPLTVLSGTAHRDDDFDVDSEGMQRLWRLEDEHFWYLARNRWIQQALARHGVRAPARVLEVGCGGGGVVRHLVTQGFSVTGVDTQEALVRKAHERSPSANFFVADVAKLDATLQHSFDAVGFFDVLEHLDDPGQLLRASMRFARPGGLVLATVPAQQALYTVIDDFAKHKMRYEVGELAGLFAQNGVVNPTEYGIFKFSVPLLRYHRRRSAGKRIDQMSDAEKKKIRQDNSRIPAAPVNVAMSLLCRLEASLGFGLSRGRPGASLLAVGSTPINLSTER
jgi:SAM-dependent methyltransferase